MLRKLLWLERLLIFECHLLQVVCNGGKTRLYIWQLKWCVCHSFVHQQCSMVHHVVGVLKKPWWCIEVAGKGSAVLRGSVVSHIIRGGLGDRLKNIKK